MMGGSHDSGSGEKLNFLSLGESDEEGDIPLWGEKASKDETLSAKDIFKYILSQLYAAGRSRLGDWCRS